jgi:hypothetical protein
MIIGFPLALRRPFACCLHYAEAVGTLDSAAGAYQGKNFAGKLASGGSAPGQSG